MGQASTIVDGRGRPTLTLKAPKRIVSTFVGADEILAEIYKEKLNQHVIAVSHLAWKKEYSRIPPQYLVGLKPTGEELERLVSLKPDMVIAASFNRGEMLHLLEASRVNTFVLSDFISFDDIRKNIELVGKLINEEKSANALVETFNSRIARINKPKRSANVLIYSSENSMVGAKTIFDDAIRAAGLKNLAADLGFSGWQAINLERLATLKPDFIIVAGESVDRETHLKEIQSRPGWQKLSAVKNGRLIMIPPAVLFTASHEAATLAEMLAKAANEK